MKLPAVRENHLFVKAYNGGKRASAKTLTVYVLKDKKAALIRRARPDKAIVNRIGLTTTKKLGGAVSRSRARRLMREAYRAVEAKTDLRHGFLIIIYAREPILKAKTPQVTRDLEYALRKTGMMRTDQTTLQPPADKPETPENAQ